MSAQKKIPSDGFLPRNDWNRRLAATALSFVATTATIDHRLAIL
jgi:hypothetical protein